MDEWGEPCPSSEWFRSEWWCWLSALLSWVEWFLLDEVEVGTAVVRLRPVKKSEDVLAPDGMGAE